MKTIHSKSEIRKDLKYTREVLRQIEKSITEGNWKDVDDAAQELSGLFAWVASRAIDNHEGIADFDCLSAYQIEQIREAERARWQKIADKVCVDLSKTTGIEWKGEAR